MYLISKVAKAVISDMGVSHAPYFFAFIIFPSSLFGKTFVGAEINKTEFKSSHFYQIQDGTEIKFCSEITNNFSPYGMCSCLADAVDMQINLQDRTGFNNELITQTKNVHPPVVKYDASYNCCEYNTIRNLDYLLITN